MPTARIDASLEMHYLIDDYSSLMKTLGIERFHLVAAKLGGTIARHFAARCPERVLTLTVAGTPPPKWDRMGAKAAHATEELEKTGVEGWARKNMAGRLGSKFPPEGVEWWTKPNSELVVLPGDSCHVAASDADRCAEEVLKFITRRQKPTVAADER